MSSTKQLKEYLLEKENAFLLDENNNRKTIMLSGAWGAGKTHFWQHEIAREDDSKYAKKEYQEGLFYKLKEKKKACVYVSLYGKDNLNSLKEEVYIKASSENKLLSSEVSTFGFDVLSSIKDSDLKLGGVVKAFYGLNNARKKTLGENRLKDGGVICFDDFERKSKDIDLNDLFGFISQLALDMKCKVVIILNSDVFEGKEAEVFKQVKEKTVNKFFYFQPTIDELFETIIKDEKYHKLADYKSKILATIKETEELNARLYIQVLDNCLEWIDSGRKLDDDTIRVLVLTTINFVLNHLVLNYALVEYRKVRIPNSDEYKNVSFLQYNIVNFYSDLLEKQYRKDMKSLFTSDNDWIKELKSKVTLLDKEKNPKLTDKDQEEHLDWIKENESMLKALWKYGYRLYYVGDVEQESYVEIAEFVKTGILLSRLTNEL